MVVMIMMMMITEDDNDCDNDGNRSVANTIMNELYNSAVQLYNNYPLLIQ